MIPDLISDIVWLYKVIMSNWKCALFHGQEHKKITGITGWDCHSYHCYLCGRDWIG